MRRYMVFSGALWTKGTLGSTDQFCTISLSDHFGVPANTRNDSQTSFENEWNFIVKNCTASTQKFWFNSVT